MKIGESSILPDLVESSFIAQNVQLDETNRMRPRWRETDVSVKFWVFRVLSWHHAQQDPEFLTRARTGSQETHRALQQHVVGRLNSVTEAGNRKGKGWLPKPGSVFFLEGYRILNGTIYKSGVKNWENYEIKSIYNVHMYKQEPHQANHTTHYISDLSFNEYFIDIPSNDSITLTIQFPL